MYITLYNELRRCIQEESQVSLTYMYIFMDHFTIYEMLIEELIIDYSNHRNELLKIKDEIKLLKNTWSKLLTLMIKANQHLFKRDTDKARHCYDSIIKSLPSMKETEKDLLTFLVILLNSFWRGAL